MTEDVVIGNKRFGSTYRITRVFQGSRNGKEGLRFTLFDAAHDYPAFLDVKTFMEDPNWDVIEPEATPRHIRLHRVDEEGNTVGASFTVPEHPTDDERVWAHARLEALLDGEQN